MTLITVIIQKTSNFYNFARFISDKYLHRPGQRPKWVAETCKAVSFAQCPSLKLSLRGRTDGFKWHLLKLDAKLRYVKIHCGRYEMY